MVYDQDYETLRILFTRSNDLPHLRASALKLVQLIDKGNTSAAELEKVIRVMKKVDAEAPHAVLLVLDATVGQNALSQVEIFGKKSGVTGLVMTKLDGTARGGILVAIAEKFKLPIHFIGVGEGVDDLQPFKADEFAKAIAGIE